MEAIHRYKPSSKYQGSSTLRLERNYGPVHTACYVSPLDGEAIKTLFSIKCTNENALYKPLKYCLSVNSLLITECITDQLIISRLPAASHIEVQVCNISAFLIDVTNAFLFTFYILNTLRVIFIP